MAAKLKVFVTSDGLTRYAVAATSRPKALAAWGVSQDLFKQGQARQADDDPLASEAIAHPGTVITRRTDARLPRPPPAPKAKRGPTAAQRRRVIDLEQKLAALETDFEAARAEMQRTRDALDQRQAAAEARYERDRRVLADRLTAARRAVPGED